MDAKKKPIKKIVRKNLFTKGHKLSVGHGRPPMTELEKARALTTRTQLKIVMTKYASWTEAELDAALEARTLPIIDIAILTTIRNATGTGSQAQIDWVLDHIMGKPAEEKNINLRGGLDNTSKIDLKKLNKEQLLQLQKMIEESEK